jgi:hypothetical protein
VTTTNWNGYESGWWFGTFGLFFHSVGNFMIPTDFHSIIFQRGGENNQPVLCFLEGKWEKDGFIN